MSEKIIKKPTYQVMVGSVPVGGGSPIVVQSMTNTDTADVQKTVEQVFELWKAGSEIVRVTVNNEASADAIDFDKWQVLSTEYESKPNYFIVFNFNYCNRSKHFN